ncbi:hypothetical protein OUZ56_007525 [Daphnia magna]|uniref:Uncharacterized protein n=1 Tax=Daphnia magna TaxID=35525 RepID=A0ABR0AA71_9CRUS|nr:hypothetical protein OUZ56_007525 [Daphnia magna]
MNNNNGHEELGGDRGPGVQDGSSTSIKQRFIQHSTSQQKVIRPTTSALSMAPQTLSPIRSLEGRRYRDILRQESLSVSKENLNGVFISSKESDDGSDDSAPTRSKSQPLGRRNKDYRHPTHRWSQFKISFDNDSVRLESEMHPLQSTGGGGGGERAGGSLPTGPSGALMTTSSSISAAGGTMAPSAPSTVPPTIKIIGKEERERVPNQSRAVKYLEIERVQRLQIVGNDFLVDETFVNRDCFENHECAIPIPYLSLYRL